MSSAPAPAPAAPATSITPDYRVLSVLLGSYLFCNLTHLHSLTQASEERAVGLLLAFYRTFLQVVILGQEYIVSEQLLLIYRTTLQSLSLTAFLMAIAIETARLVTTVIILYQIHPDPPNSALLTIAVALSNTLRPQRQTATEESNFPQVSQSLAYPLKPPAYSPC